MPRPNDYGMLLNKDIKLHRSWFKQMTSLIGITCVYKAPQDGKHFDTYGDLKAQYKEGISVGCIFQEHPDQKTLKKMGWVAELQESSSIIHVPYDLEDLQVGCLFEIPSGLDTAKPRLFRVISMQNIMVYPASIACEIAPEFEDIDEPTLHTNFAHETLPLLKDNEGDD
ncbi:MAG: hypothetical protein J6A25_00415 [Lachnospiraceae bacterium]|nr:hypothetical protein [Lachnospiraceae bacterium]